MALVRLHIFNGIPPAEHFKDGSLALCLIPPSEEGEEPTLELFGGDLEGNPVSVTGGGIDEPALEAFLVEYLPFEKGQGLGAAAYGRPGQRGTATGHGAQNFARQGSAAAGHSVSMGERNLVAATAPFSAAIGSELLVRRFAEMVDGISPADNNLVHQRSRIQQGGVARGSGGTDVCQYRGHRPRFTVHERQMYHVHADVTMSGPGGDTAAMTLDFVARWPLGGEIEIAGDVTKRVTQRDVPDWDVEPVARPNPGGGAPPRIDLVARGRGGEQVVCDALIVWHETTMSGGTPPMPEHLSSEAGDGQTVHSFGPGEDLPDFAGDLRGYVVYRGDSADTMQRYERIDPVEEYVDDGSGDFTPPENGRTYHYAFASRNRHGVESPLTDRVAVALPA